MAKQEISRFWMVWCVDGGSPTRMHNSREDAESEAQHMAVNNPGRTFVVLKAIGAFEAEEPKVTKKKIVSRNRIYPDDGVPFQREDRA